MKIFLDIETNLKHDKIWLCVTKKDDNITVWREAVGLQQYLDEHEVWAHNGIGFDFPLLAKLWHVHVPEHQQKDTLVMSRLYNPELQAPEEDPKAGNHSLKAWGIRLGNNKEESTDFDAGWTQQMEDYCIQDVMLLENVYVFLTKEMEEMKFSQQSIDLEQKVAHICKRMEDNGYTLDIPKAQTLLASLSGRMADIENSLQEVFPPTTEETKTPEYWEVVDDKWQEHRADTKTALLEALKAAGVDKPNKLIKEAIAGPMKVKVHQFNPGSRQQIAERLQSLGVELTETTEKGQTIINEDVLSAIDKPEAKLLNEYLMVQKRVALISSWLDEVKADGKVHGRIITCGAVTGRATHRSPNMAQIPNVSSPYGKECRELWNAGKGRAQVGVDLSGIELRCLAHYLNDEEWTNTLLTGDVHWMNAQSFGLVPKGTAKDDSNPEHKKIRNITKTLTYGVLYGAGAEKAGNIVGSHSRKGKQLIDNFIENTPGLASLKKKLSKFVKVGHMPGLDGRRVRIRSEHAALNTLLQSAGAIIAKQWLVESEKLLKENNISFQFMAWVHDEVQLSVLPSQAEQAASLVEKAASMAGEALKFRCRVDAEGKCGDNWATCH
jgi:DNA polymerase I-like protein with 3'-5' exonuclease and polymerase domains